MGVTNGTTETNGHGSSFAAKHNLPSHFIGGNHLGVAPPSSVKDFVAKSDGHSVITSVSFFAQTISYLSDRSISLSGGDQCTKWDDWRLAQLVLICIVTCLLGAYRQQRYCRSEGDPFRTKMGLRDLRQRACHPVHGHGYAGRSASKRRLHSHGGPVR